MHVRCWDKKESSKVAAKVISRPHRGESDLESWPLLFFFVAARAPEAETRSSGASSKVKWGDSPARAFDDPDRETRCRHVLG